MKMNGHKLSTEPYKGVRDFYPDDMVVQKYIFGKMRETVEKFGYIEYNASILEPSELYRAKTGEEIVNEQTYSFKDRGERDITLRPEMTPSLARMVAQKRRELTMPIRWYSIPNLFRYEQPQRGRMREHFQLNVDLLGSENIEAEIEIISIASAIMKNLGAKDQDFEIRINNRKIVNEIYNLFGLNEESSQKISKLIDKKHKVSEEIFSEALTTILGEKADEFKKIINSNEKFLDKLGEKNLNVQKLISLIEKLNQCGIQNVVFDCTLMRGFDYYTDTVFEVFDTDPKNKRALFGGGRYDELLDIFDVPRLPAIGFGMGDVTAKDFLEIHNLLPDMKAAPELYICKLKPEFADNARTLANNLRKQGVKVAIDLENKKIGDQIKAADKHNVLHVICLGDDEIKSQIYKVKNLKTGVETTVKEFEIFDYLHKKV